MTVEQITQALRDVSEADFEHIFDQMILIRQERQARPQVEQAQTQLLDELIDAGVLEAPATSEVAEDGTITRAEDWIDPKGDPRRAYRLGDTVRHAGADWDSVHPGLNKEEPGKGRKWVRRDAATVAQEPPTETAPQGESETPSPGEAGKKTPPGQAKKK